MSKPEHDPIFSRLLEMTWKVQDDTKAIKSDSDQRLKTLTETFTHEVELERARMNDQLRAVYARSIQLEKDIRSAVDASKLPPKRDMK